MKTCSKCGETKPLEEFQKRASNKDGYTGQCKLCKRAYDNAHYKATPSRRVEIQENSKKRIELVKAWVLSYLQEHACVDCGLDDIVVLEFDHREDKCYDIGNMLQNFGLPRIKEEIAKCDVRCANCHRRKTSIDLGWWRAQVTPA